MPGSFTGWPAFRQSHIAGLGAAELARARKGAHCADRRQCDERRAGHDRPLLPLGSHQAEACCRGSCRSLLLGRIRQGSRLVSPPPLTLAFLLALCSDRILSQSCESAPEKAQCHFGSSLRIAHDLGRLASLYETAKSLRRSRRMPSSPLCP